jgi:hypothetical protein
MLGASHLPGIPWARDIPEMDDDDLRARLGTLPVPRQVDLVLSLGWEERLKAIRNSEAAAELVPALPDEEVFLTVKQVGEGDALPIVALTTPDQLRFILDIELWTRDRLDDNKAREWLMTILACGERKVIEFLENADRDLLIIMLSKFITLIPNEDGVKIPAGLSSIMPDEFFTILSDIPEDIENIKLLLRIIRQWDRDKYYELLFDVYGMAGAEAEEKALRWRNSRIEEKGLLEFDEAVEIYGYVGEEEARRIAEEASGLLRPQEGPWGTMPTYPVRLAGSRTFFYQVLASIDDRGIQNRLRSEIAFSANRLLVADAWSIGELESIRKALNRLFSLINVGLFYLTGGDRQKGADVVKAVPVKELFQIGFSRVMDLKSAAGEVARRWWPEWGEEGFVFLDHPQDEVMRGLMLRVPQYYALAEGGDVDFRDFETMKEVDRTRQTVTEVGLVAEMCFDRLGIPKPHEARPSLQSVFVGGLEEISLRNLLVTGYVRFTLHNRFRIAPLSRADVGKMPDKVLTSGPSGERSIREETLDRFLAWLSGKTGYDAASWGILTSYIRAGVKELEDDVRGIRSWQDFDPCYVRSIIVGKD